MLTVFWICAGIGGLFLILQVALALFGFGGDSSDLGDIGEATDLSDGGDPGNPSDEGGEGDSHDQAWTRYISVQAAVTFLAFFGGGGISALELGLSPAFAVLVGFLLGVGAVYAATELFASLRKLNADGSLRVANAVGASGRVYLRVPGGNAGQGKVTVTVQGRTTEMAARTQGPDLPTGSTVRVVRLVDSSTVEVAAVADEPVEDRESKLEAPTPTHAIER